MSDIANPKNFKVRAALPAGTWTWRIDTCTGTTGGTSCASGVTWMPSSGSITVSALMINHSLYDRGFPAQTASTNVYQMLTYGDRVTRFFWSADTVWSAPAVEIDAQLHGGSQYWSQYIASRTPQTQTGPSLGISTLLVAPAAVYSKSNDADVFAKRPATQCAVPAYQTGSFPNDCSFPNSTYWNAFDGIVAQATQANLLVVIAGLVHPLDTTPYPKYPSLANVGPFARYVAARTAGFAVILSPGFDTPLSDSGVDGSTMRQLMDAAGAGAKAAAPRTIVTNHLASKSTCTDYRAFAAETSPWMTFYLFQSGHSNTATGSQTDPCSGWFGSNTETPVQGAERRTITMPSSLLGYTNPSMPNINGEGPYDNASNLQSNYDLVDIRYRLRQAGYLSSLSGAQGFTYGVNQLGTWTNPSAYWSRPSAFDMKALATRFRPYPGLPPHADWIVNNPAAYDQRQALASDGSTIAIAYVPQGDPAHPNPDNAITINTAGLPGLGCPSANSSWTLTWYNPADNTQSSSAIRCEQPSGQIILKIPGCLPALASANQECDWLLQMSKTGAAVMALQPGAPAGSDRSTRLDVWTGYGQDDDGTSAILSRLSGVIDEKPIEVSPPGFVFQDGPRVAAVPGGYLVVWHADSLDGSLLGIFGQRLGADGRHTGSALRINSTTELDQRDPAVAASPSGYTLVVWSSYGQDGDLGGIYGQLMDRYGTLLGSEIQINSISAGHQARPQILPLQGCGFAIGWTTEAIGRDPGALSLRLFDCDGLPITAEARIPGTASLHPQLVAIEPETGGTFTVRWLLRNDSQVTDASYIQRFSASGTTIGNPVELQ